jgi:hypothetical protein
MCARPFRDRHERNAERQPLTKEEADGTVPGTHRRLALTYFIVSRDVDRSRRFYTEVLGGETVLEGELSIVALANGWVTISVGGGPTDDKPTVTVVPPSDPDHASSFLNIRVADIGAVYE